jgi:TPP-dependent pyruvate/acetoin dehydrogenase alpha subunit
MLIRLNKGREMNDFRDVNDAGEDTTSERAAVHRLAATVEELMRSLMAKGLLSRSELNAIEEAVAKRIDQAPRIW